MLLDSIRRDIVSTYTQRTQQKIAQLQNGLHHVTQFLDHLITLRERKEAEQLRLEEEQRALDEKNGTRVNSTEPGAKPTGNDDKASAAKNNKTKEKPKKKGEKVVHSL